MARERYLVGAGEDTIHSGVIELKTAKDRRQNWWYYHKVHLLAGAALLAMAVSLVYSILSQPDPDYVIGMITTFNVPEEIVTQMEDELARYGEDRNGNGLVEVEVLSYVFSDLKSVSDVEALQANFARLAGDATANASMVYIAEKEALDLVAGDVQGFFQYNDGSPMPDDAVDYENAMRPWAGFKGLADFEPDVGGMDSWTPEIVDTLFSRLGVLVRTPEGAAFAKDEKDMAYYADSLSMLDRLEKGEPAEAAGNQQEK